MKNTRENFRLTEAASTRLQALSDKTGQTKTAIIERLILEGIALDRDEARLALKLLAKEAQVEPSRIAEAAVVQIYADAGGRKRFARLVQQDTAMMSPCLYSIDGVPVAPDNIIPIYEGPMREGRLPFRRAA